MQLNYHLYLNDTGYSVSAQDYILSILSVKPELSVKVNFLNTATGVGVSKNRQQLFESMKQKKDEKDQVSVYHSIPHRYRRPKGSKKYIGICLFETINPPKNWINMMNEMDEIITASEFNKGVFLSNGLKKPIHVIGHAFNTELFNNKIKPMGRYRPFTFISVGTWKKRKNWENIISAFYDAFSVKDDVCLYVKTDKPKDFSLAVQHIKKSGIWSNKETAPIYCEQKSHQIFEDIPELMSKGDVYISASLGEGFALPGLHAMALGIPIITTKFGGSLEYAKNEFATYFEPSQYKNFPVMDGIPQFQNCIWPIVPVSEISSKMIFAKNNYELLKNKAELGYDFVHSNFSYKTIGDKFLRAIQT